MSETEDYDKSATPTAHASSHENAGSDEIGVDGLAGQLADSQPSTWTLVSGKPSTFAPSAHKTSHQDAGSDEISVAGLSGTLADAQTPAAHKTSHQDGGTDEISVQGLAGTLADAQTPAAHKTSHQDGGSDEISVAGLSGTLADAQTPAAHKTSHQDGGSDEISVQGLAGLLATAQTPAGHHTTHEPGGSDILAALAPAAHKTSHQDGGSDEISVQGLSGTLADDQHVLDTEVETQILTRQKARAYRAAAQSVLHATWTKVEIDTDSFDPSSITDLVNHRVKPTLSGYYIACAQVTILTNDVQLLLIIGIFKNGAISDFGGQISGDVYRVGYPISSLLYFNGTSDYVELWLYQSSGDARSLEVDSSKNYIELLGPF
jgi:hypothetical protein